MATSSSLTSDANSEEGNLEGGILNLPLSTTGDSPFDPVDQVRGENSGEKHGDMNTRVSISGEASRDEISTTSSSSCPRYCQLCNNVDVDTKYCKDCFMFLCEPNCLPTHIKIFPVHEIIEIDEPSAAILQDTRSDDCPLHNSPLSLYCLDCKYCICQTCRADPLHANHSFKLASEFVKQDILGVYDQQIDELQESRQALQQERDNIVLQGEIAKQKIQLQTQKLLDQLTEYERQLHEAVDKDLQRKLKILHEQEKEASDVMKQLQDCEEYVELSLQYGTPEQVLMQKDNLMKHMANVMKKAQETTLEPLVEADLTIFRN